MSGPSIAVNDEQPRDAMPTRSALAILISLGARPSSRFLPAPGARYWCEPQSCCFDLASWPYECGWEVLGRGCMRCRALYEVCRVNAKDGQALVGSGLAWSIVSAAASMTHCASQGQCNGKAPTLQPALLDIIFGHVISDMRSSKNGAAVCALMHTCTAARAKVVQAFEPLGMQLYVAQFAAFVQPTSGNEWIAPFLAHFEYALVQFVEQHLTAGGNSLAASPQLPDPTDVLSTEQLPRPDAVEFYISSGSQLLHWAKRQPAPGQPLRMGDVSLALRGALEAVFSSLRPLTLYNRARSGSFEASHHHHRASISFLAKLHSEGEPFKPSFRHRSWNISPRPRIHSAC